MLKTLVFLFALSMLAMTVQTQPVPESSVEPTVRTFKPSEFPRQPKRLRKSINWYPVVVTAIFVILLAGLFWGAAVLWGKTASLMLRITIAVLGGSVAIMGGLFYFFVAFFGVTGDDITYWGGGNPHGRARQRIKRLAQEHLQAGSGGQRYCISDDAYRLSLYANADNLVVVDYLSDQGWVIPAAYLDTISSNASTLPAGTVELTTRQAATVPQNARQQLFIKLRNTQPAALYCIYADSTYSAKDIAEQVRIYQSQK